jgi:hypothetical protein
MRIVIGRGKRRTVYNLPNGSIFQSAMKNEPEAVREVVDNVCRLVGVTR